MTGSVERASRRSELVVVTMVFVVYTGFAFVLPFLPLYLRELGVTSDEDAARWAGLLIGVAPLLAGLLGPLWGRLGDRHGYKPVVLSALFAYVVLLSLSAVVRTPVELLALRVGTGLFGGIGPLGLAMVTAVAPRAQTGRGVGMVQSAQILSAAVGPFAGGFLADTIGIRLTFVVTAMLCALALSLVAVYYEAPPRQPLLDMRSGESSPVLGRSGVLLLLLILFFVNFIGRSFTPILPLHLKSLGVERGRLASSTGILISAYSLAAALSAALLGKLSRRVSPRLLLLGTLAAGGVTVLPMAAVPSLSTFVLLAVLLGLASGGSLTLCYTLAGLMVPADRRATAFGFFSGAALFGGALSPSVAGFLVRWNFRAIYYVDAALFVLLALSLEWGALAGQPGPASEGPRDPIEM
jgi:DHA1 family multidrug resistance protein-like MFS transporter